MRLQRNTAGLANVIDEFNALQTRKLLFFQQTLLRNAKHRADFEKIPKRPSWLQQLHTKALSQLKHYYDT